MTTGINIRENQPIDLTKHVETKRIAGQLARDGKIRNVIPENCGNTLEAYKQVTLSILRQANKNSNMVSSKQLKYLEDITQNYQRLIEFNEDFEENLRDETIELIEETREYMSSNDEGSHTLQGMMTKEINRLNKNYYIWDNSLIWLKRIIRGDYNKKHPELDLPKNIIEKYEKLSQRLYFDFNKNRD